MKYISVQEAAEQWGISLRRVQFLCANEKIPGAVHVGRQWVIPADAARPADGRTRSGKMQPAAYHFPIFIYSSMYGDSSELNEKERRLLQAQKLRLEGKYLDCIAVCRSILSKPVPRYLAAGVHCTIGFASLLLGIVSEYKNSIEELVRILNDEPLHSEDIRLMIMSLRNNGSWDASQIFSIDPLKLSAEAVVYYKYCLMCVVLLSGTLEGEAAFRYVRSDMAQFERDGITPALFSFHCLLGVIKNPENGTRENELHMRSAVRLAVENNWIANLSRYYNCAPSLMEKCLNKYGHGYVTELKKIHQTTIKNWGIIHYIETGSEVLGLWSSEQIELLLLVSYQYSNEEIASVKSMTKADVRQSISELCRTAGVDTKAELTAYSKKLFNTMTM